MINLIGQKFNRLTVIRDSGRRQKGSIKWLCRCDCGGEIKVTGSRLSKGSVKGCGCLQQRDLTGQRFGRLLVIEDSGERHKRSVKWLCKCVCGNSVKVVRGSLVNGLTKSCGCLHKEQPHSFKHGRCKPRSLEYISWDAMKQRCLNPKNPAYERYGGCGITICERWMNFINFYADMGPRPERAYELDREDPYGDYEPSNCRWVLKGSGTKRPRNFVR